MRCFILVTLFAVISLHGYGQTPPTLKITKESSTSVRLSWNSQTGNQYQILHTATLDVFAQWNSVTEAIPATGIETSVVLTSPNPTGFLRLHTLGLPSTGLPTAKIISPGTGDTVSGLIRVFAHAQDDSRLSFASLSIDGKEYDAAISEGELHWTINTGHFPNGAHTLVVRVVDNAGNGALGGNSDSNVAGNEVLSEPITLNFNNVVRWIEPVSGFETFVPISIRSDTFPSDWTVHVEDESGTIIRTFTGFTSDGIVETEWDGNDNNGAPAPAEKAYRVVFTLGQFVPEPPGGGGGTTNDPPPIPSGSFESSPRFLKYNEYGSPVYEVTTWSPLLPPMFFDEDFRNKAAAGLLPPLPPLTDEDLALERQGPRLRKRKLSIIEAASLSSRSLPATTQAMNDHVVWRESPWQNGEIILARQKFQGSILPNTLNAAFGGDLNTLATDIETAALADDRLNGRVVYGGGQFVADVNADFDVLLNDLSMPQVRDFYYIGHSNGEAIGYSEGAKQNGITSTRLASRLGNKAFHNVPAWDGRSVYSFKKPFRFAFINGCLSSKGTFKTAFGIIEDNDNTRVGKKRRAHLGWNATTQNSIINDNHRRWSARFWKEWVNTAIDDFDVRLQDAIDSATDAIAIPEKPITTGYRRLTWAE